jgi:hypothetical protein
MPIPIHSACRDEERGDASVRTLRLCVSPMLRVKEAITHYNSISSSISKVEKIGDVGGYITRGSFGEAGCMHSFARKGTRHMI